MNKLFLRVTFIALLAVSALHGETLSAKTQSGSGLESLLADLDDDVDWAILSAKAQPGSGLEIGNPKEVEVLIEDLNNDAKEAGLSKGLILAKVNLRLRQNGLIPINRKSKNVNQDGYLYVNINVSNNAFSIGVAFFRPVFYSNNQLVRMHTIASTWRTGSTGTFGRNKNFILNSLENHIDVFIDAYLSANNL